MHNLRTLTRSSNEKGADFSRALETTLFSPLEVAMGRPSKRVRSELFSVLMEECAERLEPGVYERIGELLECLHTASIVIDDIEDETLERRGSPSLHIQYGVPVALNAASWLLISPFVLLRKMNLNPTSELKVTHAIADTLLQAHEGQAVDVGTDVTSVSQASLAALWLKTAELKTGALMALAAQLPWLCVEDSQHREEVLATFGSAFGIGLQMLDDVSDFFSIALTDDLLKRRLNFAMVVAASELSQMQYAHLCKLLRNIEGNHLEFLNFVSQHRLRDVAIAKAREHLEGALTVLISSGYLKPGRHEKLNVLKEKLINAFTA